MKSDQKGWTDDELALAMTAYFEVLDIEASGGKFSPTAFHRKVVKTLLPGRTEGSVARRMSNLSSAFSQFGLPVSNYYKPSFDNVGTGIRARIGALYASLVADHYEPSIDYGLLEAKTAAVAEGLVAPPTGSAQPGSASVTTIAYKRSLKVRAWVLSQAQGRCEACEKPAPFSTAAGVPFLEVHHLRQLAEGGSDTVSNAVAICPNCHRHLHLGGDRSAYRSLIIDKIDRLLDE